MGFGGKITHHGGLFDSEFISVQRCRSQTHSTQLGK